MPDRELHHYTWTPEIERKTKEIAPLMDQPEFWLALSRLAEGMSYRVNRGADGVVRPSVQGTIAYRLAVDAFTIFLLARFEAGMPKVSEEEARAMESGARPAKPEEAR